MTDHNPNISGPPVLAGEVAEGKAGMKTNDGAPVDPSHTVFPIIRQRPDGTWDLLGTGFFISTNGLFVTARHVLQAPFDKSGTQQYPIALIHFHETNKYVIRPILRSACHPIADVAVGVAAPMTRNSDETPLMNRVLTLTITRPQIPARVVTYAYPRYSNMVVDGKQMINMMPRFYGGDVIEHLPGGRDSLLLPGPCYRTNIAIHHGASGGPVFSPIGAVFAVNSTGFDGTDVSYVSSINEIFELTVDDVAMNGQSARSVRVRELARAGYIVMDTPIP